MGSASIQKMNHLHLLIGILAIAGACTSATCSKDGMSKCSGCRAVSACQFFYATPGEPASGACNEHPGTCKCKETKKAEVKKKLVGESTGACTAATCSKDGMSKCKGCKAVSACQFEYATPGEPASGACNEHPGTCKCKETDKTEN